MKKLLSLLLFTGLLIGAASAASFDQSTYTETYGDGAHIDVTVNHDTVTTRKVYLSPLGCEGEISRDYSGRGASTTTIFQVNVPGDFSCSLGTHTMEFSSSAPGVDSATADLKVEPYNMQPNRGDHVYVKMDYDAASGDAGPLYAFFLSDDEWTDTYGGYPEMTGSGTLSVEAGTDFRCAWRTDVTGIIEGSEPSGFGTWGSTWDIIEDGRSCAGVTDDIREQGFTAMGQNLDDSTYDLGSKTPLHDNQGDYELDGELARGYEPGEPGTPVPFWYICRRGYLGPSGSGKVINITADGGSVYKCDATDSSKGDPTYPWEDNLGSTQVGKWYKVHNCNDDLDNDGDASKDNGGIDGDGDKDGNNADPDCNGHTNRNLEGTNSPPDPSCSAGETRVVKHYIDPSEKAFFFQKCMNSPLTDTNEYKWHEHLYWNETGFEKHDISNQEGEYNNWSLQYGLGKTVTFDDLHSTWNEPSAIEDRAENVSCLNTDSVVTTDRYIGADGPYEVDCSKYDNEFVAVFNGTGNGNVAKWGRGWAREGPHEQSVSQAKNQYGISGDICKLYDNGEWNSTGEVKNINCRDKKPRGWVAVNYGEDKGTGDIGNAPSEEPWSSLRNSYSYDSNIDIETQVENESQPENSPVWTGGWIGNCEAGSTWQVVSQNPTRWDCGPGAAQTVDVTFFNVKNPPSDAGSIYVGFNFTVSDLKNSWKTYFDDLDYTDDLSYADWLDGMCWTGSMPTKWTTGNVTNFTYEVKSGNQFAVVRVPQPGGNSQQYGCRFGFRDDYNPVFQGRQDSRALEIQLTDTVPFEESTLENDKHKDPWAGGFNSHYPVAEAGGYDPWPSDEDPFNVN